MEIIIDINNFSRLLFGTSHVRGYQNLFKKIINYQDLYKNYSLFSNIRYINIGASDYLLLKTFYVNFNIWKS